MSGATKDSLELLRLEIALAREDLHHDMERLKAGLVLAASSVVCALLATAALIVALGVALGTGLGLVLSGVLFGAAFVLGALAARRFPRAPSSVAGRLRRDARALRERASRP